MKQALKIFWLLCLAIPLMAQSASNKRRGRYLRSEVRGTDAQATYEVKLVNSKSSFLQFVFKKILILKIREVKIYETVLEKVTSNGGEGVTPRGAVDYVILPGEFIEGEESIRTERRYDGNMKMELFTLNGKAYTTDENGIWTDEEQLVLSMFDEMRSRLVKLEFRHKELGSASIQLSRNLIKREVPVVPGTVQEPVMDVLEALGMDFSQLRQSTNDSVVVQANYKKTAKPGEIIAVTLDVKNNGMHSISNMIGRSFSSASSLDGRMFYFGMLPPGQKRSFSRLIAMPQMKGPCYFRIAFWSVAGVMKNNAIDLNVLIE